MLKALYTERCSQELPTMDQEIQDIAKWFEGKATNEESRENFKLTIHEDESAKEPGPTLRDGPGHPRLLLAG